VRLTDFDYPLPKSAIAQEPLAERDGSRLLVLDRKTGALAHHTFRDLPDLLSPGDLLVTNRSRVFPARLLGERPTGGSAEVLLVRPVDGLIWEALVRPGRRLKPGTEVRVDDDLTVVLENEPPLPDGRRRVRLLSADVDAALERAGHVPLPPYIRRRDHAGDHERYQTVFAREKGSVAAPTAGLHFTPALLERLRASGIDRSEVVLHVGPGTFRPVEVADVQDHTVPAEPFVLPEETAMAINKVRAAKHRLVAVGTTTTRVLETLAARPSPLTAASGETDLVIRPGFSFRMVDALVTNFHLPRSSLLLLVSAFAGREPILAAYAEALRRGYRFYSYGDAMLLL
jgi:S-adenosylmethionine:tRNA ribosyltransferase-isomerase